MTAILINIYGFYGLIRIFVACLDIFQLCPQQYKWTRPQNSMKKGEDYLQWTSISTTRSTNTHNRFVPKLIKSAYWLVENNVSLT